MATKRRGFDKATAALVALCCSIYNEKEAPTLKERNRNGDVFLMGKDDFTSFHNSRSISDMTRITAANEKLRAFGGNRDLVAAFNDLASGDNLIAAMRTFTAGYAMNDGLEDEIQFLSPDVQAPAQRVDYTDHTGGLKGLEFDVLDERAARANYKVLHDAGEEQTIKLPERGLAVDIDVGQYPDLAAATSRAQAKILARLRINRLRRAVAALIAIATNNNVTWDGTAGCNPDGQVKGDIAAGHIATAVRNNRVYYGEAAWSLRETALAAQTAPALAARANYTPEQLAGLLQVAGVMVSKAVQIDGGGSISAIMGSKVISFQNFAGADLDDSSICKTFWAPVQGGGRYFTHPLRQVGDMTYRVVISAMDKTVITGPATNTVRGRTVS